MKKLVSLVLVLVFCFSTISFAGAEDKELLTVRILGIDHTESGNGETLYFSEFIENNGPVWQAFVKHFEKYALKLELDLIPADQYEVVVQTRLASGLNCDWMNITPMDDQTRIQLADIGKFRSFNEIAALGNGIAKSFFSDGYGAKLSKLYAQPNGEFYWVPAMRIGMLGDQLGGSYMSMIVRQDWLTKLGMEMPKTAEAFKDMLVAFQENDMNGNGEKDEVLSVEFNDFRTGVAQWFGIGPSIVYVDMTDNEVKTPWYSDNIKAYVSYMADLVSAGLVDTSNQADQKVIENKISATHSWSAETWFEATIQVQEGETAGYYVPMLAKAVEGVEPFVLLQTSPTYSGHYFAMINDGNNVEAQARLLDAIYDDELWSMGILNDVETTYNGVTYPARTAVGLGYDENGDRIYIPLTDLNAKEAAVAPIGSVQMWTYASIFPYVEFTDREIEIQKTIETGRVTGYPETGWVEKGEAFRSFFSYNVTSPYSTASVLPVFTAEEAERLAELKTDLKTYSDELITKLILGQKSLNDWDSYIADLQRLGLDEYLGIYAACYGRTK